MTAPGAPPIHVFCGPTLPAAEVRATLPGATIHPPVGCRDLGGLDWRPGAVAAIVDGLFLQAPAVRHKEILSLLERGVTVYGASSMGALRAAELRHQGMIGVGLVYRLYALGVIDRDDEVAIAHTPVEHGCRPLSVALVSIRVAARRARVLGVLDQAHERLIVDTAAGMPFPARRWKSVARAAAAAGGSAARCAAFLDYCTLTDPDVKRDDARRLLRELARGARSGARSGVRSSARPGAVARPAHPWTHFQQIWETEARGTTVEGRFVADRDALRCLQLVAPDFPAFYRRFCLTRIAADGAGVAPGALSGMTDADLEERALATAHGRGLLTGVGAATLAHYDLGEHAGPSRLDREVALRLLVRSYRHEPGAVPVAQLIEVLAGAPCFTEARHLVARAGEHLDRLTAADSRHRADHVAERAVARCLSARWPDGYRPGAAHDRAFPSLRTVVRAARALVPYLAGPGAALPGPRIDAGLREPAAATGA